MKVKAKNNDESYEFLKTPLARVLKEKHLVNPPKVFKMIEQKRKEYLKLINASHEESKKGQEQLERSVSHSRLVRRQVRVVAKKRKIISLSTVETMKNLEPLRSFTSKVYVTWRSIMSEIYNPEAREGATLSVIKDKLYLIGGHSTELIPSISMIHLHSNEWFSAPSKGVRTYGHSAHQCFDRIIFYGGAGAFSELTNKTVCQNSVRAFNGVSWSDVFTEGGTMEARKYHAAAIYGTYLVMHGGVNNRSSILSDIWVLSLRSCKWSRLETTGASMISLYGHTATASISMLNASLFKSQVQENVISGIYFFGGRNEKSSNRLYLLVAGERPLQLKQLKTNGKPPAPRYFHSAHKIGTNLFIVGGTCETGDFLKNEIYVNNLVNLTWSYVVVAGIELPNRYSHASTALGDKIYIFGGCSAGKFLKAELVEINTNQLEVKSIMDSFQL